MIEKFIEIEFKGGQQRLKKQPRLNKKQMQHFKLDNLAGDSKKSDVSYCQKTSPPPTHLTNQNHRNSRQNLDSFNRRNLSAESLHNRSNFLNFFLIFIFKLIWFL